MPKVHASNIPDGSLIAPDAVRPGTYTDAFFCDVAGNVPLPTYLRAFYTTPLFRAERVVLSLAGQRSSDADLDALAESQGDRFAAWKVEARRADEVLLADVGGATKSWLKVTPNSQGSRLWFGSVVVPVDTPDGPRMPRVMAVLTTPHRLYSRALLSAAARRLAG